MPLLHERTARVCDAVPSVRPMDRAAALAAGVGLGGALLANALRAGWADWRAVRGSVLHLQAPRCPTETTKQTHPSHCIQHPANKSKQHIPDIASSILQTYPSH
jgi:hypothetical protein